MLHTEISRTLFNAFETADAATVRSLFHPEARLRQNSNPEMSIEELLQFSLAVKNLVPDLHYENIICSDTGTGFVEEHDVCGTLPDGSELRLVACVVANIEDGKIVQLREYVDTAAAQGLLAALAG